MEIARIWVERPVKVLKSFPYARAKEVSAKVAALFLRFIVEAIKLIVIHLVCGLIILLFLIRLFLESLVNWFP